MCYPPSSSHLNLVSQIKTLTGKRILSRQALRVSKERWETLASLVTFLWMVICDPKNLTSNGWEKNTSRLKNPPFLLDLLGRCGPGFLPPEVCSSRLRLMQLFGMMMNMSVGRTFFRLKRLLTFSWSEIEVYLAIFARFSIGDEPKILDMNNISPFFQTSIDLFWFVFANSWAS